MKVLSAGQIRKADAYTIANVPVDSFRLMERASSKCAEWIMDNFDSGECFTVICGTGNNGGDGLCIARLLKNAGRTADVVLIPGTDQSVDFKKALSSAEAAGVNIRESGQQGQIPFDLNPVVIDAIFGTGVNRPVEGAAAAFIKSVNDSGCTIVSIDMPSGLIADEPTTGPVINATYTLTFQSPKSAFLFPGTGIHAGEFHVLDIGLDKGYIEGIQDAAEYVTVKQVARLIKPRLKFSHKGDYGKALLIAGSHGKMGAAIMAARSCLRTGAGLLTVHIPECGYASMQTALPEAMCTTDENNYCITDAGDFSGYDAIGIGPGLGTSAMTEKMVLNFAGKCNRQAVIDADALNILSANRQTLSKLHPLSILTPHPGEFERLAGRSENDFHRHRLQREFTETYKVIVILKGAYTCITVPGGRTYFNSTGNPAMAKGGTGDALTGVLLGLLSQGYSPEHSAILGVYLHGLAGDLAAIETGEHSMLCSDLIEHIPAAYKFIENAYPSDSKK